MTAQEYRLQTSMAAAHSAAVVMALVAVAALGLMGFAMGYAKADHPTAAWRSISAQAQPLGVDQAVVSPVTPGQNDLLLAAAVTPAAPQAAAAPRPKLVATPAVVASAPTEAVAAPVLEPVMASDHDAPAAAAPADLPAAA